MFHPTNLSNTSSMNVSISDQYLVLGNVVEIKRNEEGGGYVVCDALLEDLVAVAGWTGNDPNIITSGAILFHKNKMVNETGLKGYYSEVTFENNSVEKCELFSVSSEINISSK